MKIKNRIFIRPTLKTLLITQVPVKKISSSLTDQFELDTLVLTNRRNKQSPMILRVKKGYNPNSSSMGSFVFSLPGLLFVFTLGFGLVLGLVMSFFKNPLLADNKKQNSAGLLSPSNKQEKL
ncbi:MAG: hypothetical protein JXR70_17745 [Spirochaetales bacterium]|nr:hypothetical protein [Spirochaetales bacterium]